MTTNDAKQRIVTIIYELAAKVNAKPGLEHLDLDDLLREEPNLTVEMGTFPEVFKILPQPILMGLIETHPTLIPLFDDNDRLVQSYLLMSDLVKEEAISHRVRKLHHDFEEDKKSRLEIHAMEDNRLTLAKAIAIPMGIACELAERTVKLSEADLHTKVVTQYPNLHGIMGYYCALNDGEHEALAYALKEQIHPRFLGDRLPNRHLADVLVLVNRLDFLAAEFRKAGPVKAKDASFDLYFAAETVLRIVIEKHLDINLPKLIQIALVKDDPPLDRALFDFFYAVLKRLYEKQQVSMACVAAVSLKYLCDPYDFHLRVIALQAFLTQEKAHAVLRLNHWIDEELNKAAILVEDKVGAIDPDLLEEGPEEYLVNQISAKWAAMEPFLKAREYAEVFNGMEALIEPIQRFKKEVWGKSAKDYIIINRLTILSHLKLFFNEVGSLSHL